MILGENNKKPNIDYPCKWTFKVIGDDVDTMINSMEKAVEGRVKQITLRLDDPKDKKQA